MNKYPDLKSAISLWQESLTGILSASPSEKIPQEYGILIYLISMRNTQFSLITSPQQTMETLGISWDS